MNTSTKTSTSTTRTGKSARPSGKPSGKPAGKSTTSTTKKNHNLRALLVRFVKPAAVIIAVLLFLQYGFSFLFLLGAGFLAIKAWVSVKPQEKWISGAGALLLVTLAFPAVASIFKIVAILGFIFLAVYYPALEVRA